MMKFRGAVLGCGKVSDFHLLGWQRIPEVTIVALCDPDRARAEAQARRFSVSAAVYDSAKSMFAAEALDFVDILAPPDKHKALCLQAKRAGVHVICQKPLCPDRYEAKELVAAFNDSTQIFAVHENHRYRPWFREILERNARGLFGPIRYVRLEQHDAQEPSEAYKTASRHGVMLEYGVHLVDMMRALLGEPQHVSASFGRLNPRVLGESLAVATYQYEGATVVIDVAWKAAGPELGRLIVEGERGTALYEGTMTRGERARFRLFKGGDCILDENRIPTDDYLESFYLVQREYINSLLNGSRPPQRADDNLLSLLATFDAYEAARTFSTGFDFDTAD
jgi:predicted dehydrogenase